MEAREEGRGVELRAGPRKDPLSLEQHATLLVSLPILLCATGLVCNMRSPSLYQQY